ncbi:MAG: ATP-binding cassette domain-containing protein [Deltaproteobacteria bacterium]|nr:ATP-binding cassette domain-containing protein [Deltaproteobacteria bacterium]
MSEDVVIPVENYGRHFGADKSPLIKAVRGVSPDVRRGGEIFGLAGESGSGKSTPAKAVTGLRRPTGGGTLFKGADVSEKRERRRHGDMIDRGMQVIFQDSAAAPNPRIRAADIITEPLAVDKVHRHDKAAPNGRVVELTARAGLDARFKTRRPGEISGGRRQRTAIARAPALEPELIVADEPAASLDVSIRAQIVNLFQKLQKERSFAFLFVARDLPMVLLISDRAGVMFAGRLAGLSSTGEIFQNPPRPRTRSLMSAVPSPDPACERAKKIRKLDPDNPRTDGIMAERGPGHFLPPWERAGPAGPPRSRQKPPRPPPPAT